MQKKRKSLNLFKKQDNIRVCVFYGFVINQDEQKAQFFINYYCWNILP